MKSTMARRIQHGHGQSQSRHFGMPVANCFQILILLCILAVFHIYLGGIPGFLPLFGNRFSSGVTSYFMKQTLVPVLKQLDDEET